MSLEVKYALLCHLNWISGIVLGWIMRDTLQAWRDAKKRWAMAKRPGE